MNLFDLRGRTALITGAAGLLGVEHAEALLEVGAKIVLTDIDAEALNFVQEFLNKKFDSEKIILEVMNVTKKDEIDKVANNLWNKNLHIDILVNNAAIDPKVKKDHSFSETSRFENFMLDQWNLEILVGLTGAFLASQIFGTLMAERNSGGVILNIASDLSVISPDQRLYQKEELTADLQPVKPVTTLTVAEMIEALSKLPPDAKLVMTESGFYSDVEFAEVMLPEPYIVGTRKTDYKPDLPDGTQVYRIGHSKQWY